MSEETISQNNAGKQNSGTITIRKDSLWKYATIVLAVVVVIGAFFFFTSNGTSPTGGAIRDIPSDNSPGVAERVEVDIGNAPVLGDKNAPVTIVEFSDYQCPYCERHFTQTYPQLKANYVDTGKAKIVFMDFPLSFHPEAQKAAEAARCAGEQGKYWEMHDKLFENQATLSPENEKKWARELGIDGAKFDTCLNSGKYTKAVQDDLNYGASLGIQGTPGFFVNGILVNGAQPFSAFKAVIDAELA